MSLTVYLFDFYDNYDQGLKFGNPCDPNDELFLKKDTMKLHVLGSRCFECEALVYVSLRPEGFYARTGYIEGILEGIKEDLVQNVDEKSYRCHIKQD